VLRRLTTLGSNIQTRSKKTYISVKRDIQKRPLTNFYLAIGLLVLLIILSNVLHPAPKDAVGKDLQTKQVSLYSIGSVPKMQIQAQIEKSGVITVVALSGGVVQTIQFHEGDTVSKGDTLVSLSSNYQGGNASSVQRQLAQTQYQAAVDTFGIQNDVINRQRDIATASAQSSADVRQITNDSLGATRDLISLNQTMLDNVTSQLIALQQNPQADPGMIASLQGQRAQLLQATTQAQSGLRSAEYQSASDKPPAQMAEWQKEIALKGLDLQQKTLNVNKEAARLQLQLAQVAEALMYPSAPVTGVVQRVFVKEGDVVSPGQQLAVVAQAAKNDPIRAVAYVPRNLAERISRIEPSVLMMGDQRYEEYPYFVSGEAVQGNSYAVYYAVPDSFSSSITEKGYITVEIPVGYPDTTSSATYVPIDAVYQTSDSAYLFVNEKGKAKSRKVSLGDVYGTYVAVTNGLQDGDQVIVTRNVIDSDPVQVSR
jgi:multidrug efflux pump subunit AcrA (membrane-fusion protein)